MDGSIEKRNSSNDSNGMKDKLKFLKNSIKEYGGVIPDSVQGPLNEGIDIAEKALFAQGILKDVAEFLDMDLDIMGNLDEIKEVLEMLKKSALWLKNSEAGIFIVDLAAEVVEEIVQFEEMADKLKLVGIESKEGQKIAEEMRGILERIVEKLNKAIDAIEFVKVLKDAEMNWEGLKKMMEYIESKQ